MLRLKEHLPKEAGEHLPSTQAAFILLSSHADFLNRTHSCVLSAASDWLRFSLSVDFS